MCSLESFPPLKLISASFNIKTAYKTHQLPYQFEHTELNMEAQIKTTFKCRTFHAPNGPNRMLICQSLFQPIFRQMRNLTSETGLIDSTFRNYSQGIKTASSVLLNTFHTPAWFRKVTIWFSVGVKGTDGDARWKRDILSPWSLIFIKAVVYRRCPLSVMIHE